MNRNDSPVHENTGKLLASIRDTSRLRKARGAGNPAAAARRPPGGPTAHVLLRAFRLCPKHVRAAAGGLAIMFAAILAATGPAMALDAGALPAGGRIVYGRGRITASGNNMTVVQKQNKMVLDWNTFNIGRDASVRFMQPGTTSSALNRILDQNPSQIFGSLKSNGLIFLLNPAGIIFGPTARVDVGGLVASSLDLSVPDYLSGNYTFTATGLRDGITNRGTIKAAKYGVVALIAPQVSNRGTIAAPGGSVALAAGNRVTLDFAGDGLVKLSVEKSVLEGEIQNGGAAKAGADQVVMTPKAAQEVESTVVNNSGIIKAESIKSKNGEIILDGGQSGKVTNSGSLTARGNDVGETGGTVTVTGNRVELASESKIDVCGNSGGGTVNVGGGPHGAEGGIRNADEVSMDKGAQIHADATGRGSGGTVALWSQKHTDFAGSISARGGPLGGNGGWVETSSKNVLEAAGAVTTLAPLGASGEWLLDPADITIADSGGTITPTTIETGLTNNNVTLDTHGGSGADPGNITVSSAVSWSSTETLNLFANANINVNAAITGSGGGNLVLRADSMGMGTGTVRFGSPGLVSLTGGSGGGNNVWIYYNPTSYSSPTDYSLYVRSSSLAAYMLVNNVNDLQNMSENLAGDYALGTNIDAGATSGWNGGAGFTPLGSPSNPFAGVFNGNGQTITGLYINLPSSDYVGLFGYTSGATIQNVGLINGSITGQLDVGGLAGHALDTSIIESYNTGQVRGHNNVGGIAGFAQNGAIDTSSNTGAVSGYFNTGGLVGYAWDTTITSSTNGSAGDVTPGAVTGQGDGTGGIAGQMYGDANGDAAIVGSFNYASVSGPEWTGGLVGMFEDDGASYIGNSDNYGAVSGAGYTGGLAGVVFGYTPGSAHPAVWHCNNSGAVQATGSYTGGLVGWAQDTYISGSSNTASGTVSGVNQTGGLVGWLEGDSLVALIDSSSNKAMVTGRGSDTGGLAGYMGGYEGAGLTTSFNSGAVNGGADTGGLAGRVDSGTALSNSYNSGAVTGSGDYVGGTAGLAGGMVLNTANLGNVYGGGDVGGICGHIDANGLVSYSYSIGTVKSSGVVDVNVGGVAGSAAAGVAMSTDYFDTTTSGLTNTWDIAQGLTDSRMAQQSSFSGWDFTNTWAIGPGLYPYLEWAGSWGGPQVTPQNPSQNYLGPISSSLTESLVTETTLGGAQTVNGTSSIGGALTEATTEGGSAEVDTEAAPVGGVASDAGLPQSQTVSANELIRSGAKSQGKGKYAEAARDFRGAVVNLLELGAVPQARRTIEMLEAAELQDYYQDASIAHRRVHGIALKDLHEDVAVVYTMILPHSLDLIVCFRSGMKRYSIPIDAAALSRDIDRFRIGLQRRTSWSYMPEARKLYTLIIKPIEPELAIRGIDTLVFIPDGALRTVPFAALNDGRRFLIEKYAVAIVPSLALTDSRAILPKKPRALAAGLTKSVQGFAPLPNVAGELKDVHGLYKSDLLENVDFVSANVRKDLSENPYSIVHIATHGNFGPKGQDTFLLTWDSKIDMNQLQELMEHSKEHVGLLCLSACETAAGDDRAALGLAGVAVKAGTRCALATLWNVSDQAAPELVRTFYDALKVRSVSKAQALQQAQLKLMDDPRFSHPYYWSPFLLIGNWR